MSTSIEDFEKVDIRVGKILEVENFSEAKKPSYKLTIDFGPEVGIKRSAGRFPARYAKEDLIGKKILCVVNLPPRQIGPFVSESLTLGVPDENHEAILIVPDQKDAVVGDRMY